MVDIEKIMQEIRTEIKEKGLDKEILSFESDRPRQSSQVYDCFDFDFFVDNTERMNRTCLLQPNKPITGNPIAVLIKKTIRKLTRFYIAPIVTDQSEFNIYMTKVANSIRYYIQEEKKDKQRIENLLQRVEALEKQLAGKAEE